MEVTAADSATEQLIGQAQTFRLSLGSSNVKVENLLVAEWLTPNGDSLGSQFRDQEEVGAFRPNLNAAFYRLSTILLTHDEVIQVIGGESSGEVEPVLVVSGGQLWVGLGSDHTDRTIEAYDVAVSKQVCPKPVCREFWPYEEIADHWDAIRIRSYALCGDLSMLYQEDGLGSILDPIDLLRQFEKQYGSFPDNTAMFCGTVAVKTNLIFAHGMMLELEDPVHNRKLQHKYMVKCLTCKGFPGAWPDEFPGE